MDDMQLTGFKELAEALKELGPRVARISLRYAVSNGAAVVRDEARRIAPESAPGSKSKKQSPPGTLKKAIAIKRNRDSRDVFNAKYSVFVKSSAKDGVKAYGSVDGFYGYFLEFGTSKMAARPFLRPAFDHSIAKATDEIAKALDYAIQYEATELSKK